MSKPTYSIIGYTRKEHKWVLDVALRVFPDDLMPLRPYDDELDGILLTNEETDNLVKYSIGDVSTIDHTKNIYVLEQTDDLGTLLALGHALNH